LLDAAAEGDRPRIESLIRKGGNVNYRSPKDGRTPVLAAAAGTCHADLIKLLLSKGADPKARDNRGSDLVSHIDLCIRIIDRETEIALESVPATLRSGEPMRLVIARQRERQRTLIALRVQLRGPAAVKKGMPSSNKKQ
jgi:hypothetical protein